MVNTFTLFLAVYMIADAIHDKLVIEGRANVTVKWKENAWHLVDSFIKGGISMYVLYLLGLRDWKMFLVYSVYFMFFRSIWFNLWLNLFRVNVNIWHLGNSGYEGWFTKRGKEKLFWVSGIATTILIYIIINII